MKKFIMTVAMFGLALTPALTFVETASASDGSSIHSDNPQDHMLTPWAPNMQESLVD